MTKHYDQIIVGYGQIGKSLHNVLKQSKKTVVWGILDPSRESLSVKTDNTSCDVLHVCFPYTGKFETDIKDYICILKPKIVIIHSTLKVGTTDRLINKFPEVEIAHSPVTGQHPHLEESLKTFPKYVGTKNESTYKKVKEILKGMKTIWIKDPKSTELGKLLCTSYYGINIAWHREMKRFCDKFGVDFNETVTTVTENYNKGYKKFRPNVIRPILTPPEGPIGGHCVVPNAEILNNQARSAFLKLIK